MEMLLAVTADGIQGCGTLHSVPLAWQGHACPDCMPGE